MLIVRCRRHPRYAATQKPRGKCRACHLLYILRWQHSKTPDKRLGGVNPYQFIGDLEEACGDLKITVPPYAHPVVIPSVPGMH